MLCQLEKLLYIVAKIADNLDKIIQTFSKKVFNFNKLILIVKKKRILCMYYIQAIIHIIHIFKGVV